MNVYAQGTANKLVTFSQNVSEAGKDKWEELAIGLTVKQAVDIEVVCINADAIKPVFFDNLEVKVQAVPTVLVVQENHYYPFGLGMKGLDWTLPTNAKEDKFTYNGKEKQTDFDLGWSYYGARMYDPQIGRMTSVDRFAEKYYSMSSYQYGANNPIKYIDVNGDSIVVRGSDEFKARYALDRANLEQTKEGKALFEYLDNCNCEVGISEATSVLGSMKNMWEEGSGNRDILSASGVEETKHAVILLQYSQLNGVDYEGGKSKSFITLAHELSHAKDFADGAFDKDTKYAPKTVRKKGEERAVQFENTMKVAFGDTDIRATYKGFGQVVPAGTTWKTYDTKQRVTELKSLPKKKQP